MYVGDDALNHVAPARAMGMVSVWYNKKMLKLNHLKKKLILQLTTVEELLTILPIKTQIIKEKIMGKLMSLRKDEHRYITVH